MKRIMGIAVALLLAGSPAGAVTLTAEVAPQTAHIGDRIAYTITARDAAGVELPQTLEHTEPFELLAVEAKEEGGAKKLTFTLTIFKTGTFTLPPYAALWRAADGAMQRTEAPAAAITIDPLLKPGDKDPQMMPIEDIVEPAFDWRPYLWPGVAVWASFGLLASLLWVFRKWQERKESATAAVPHTPYETAIAALKRIEAEDRYSHGEGKAHFAAIADTLRLYLRDEYGVDAPEKTTQELETAWPALLDDHRERVFYCLRTCDIAKFTNKLPDREDATSALAVASYFVENAPKMKSLPAVQPESSLPSHQ